MRQVGTGISELDKSSVGKKDIEDLGPERVDSKVKYLVRSGPAGGEMAVERDCVLVEAFQRVQEVELVSGGQESHGIQVIQTHQLAV